MLTTISVSLLLTLSGLQTAYSQCKLNSTKSGPVLVELYTSEGCSSCPPADLWQNKFKHDPKLWSRFVPITFHVDYWDYLGWKDKLANPAYAQRQRHFRRKGLARAVYTPGFFVNGKEWRGFFGTRNIPAKNPDSTGQLKVLVNKQDVSGKYTEHSHGKKPLSVNIALLGFGIAHKVIAGENTGRTLKHDFAVLHHITSPIQSNGQWKISLNSIKKYRGHMASAIAVWVNHGDNPQPLQVTGGWINNCL